MAQGEMGVLHYISSTFRLRGSTLWQNVDTSSINGMVWLQLSPIQQKKGEGDIFSVPTTGCRPPYLFL
jgi:hypothetical protein